ncbi:hypothetical protein DL96DRAFT_1720326 [Flagelloscypha sp. PMI_526]|nr:hypothetical protein DL96DRAFT_1720326 [Flagelloscypha sp. PMI_526]
MGNQTFDVPRLSSIARMVPWFTFVQNDDGSSIIFTGSAADHYLTRSQSKLPFALPSSWTRAVQIAFEDYLTLLGVYFISEMISPTQWTPPMERLRRFRPSVFTERPPGLENFLIPMPLQANTSWYRPTHRTLGAGYDIVRSNVPLPELINYCLIYEMNSHAFPTYGLILNPLGIIDAASVFTYWYLLRLAPDQKERADVTNRFIDTFVSVFIIPGCYQEYIHQRNANGPSIDLSAGPPKLRHHRGSLNITANDVMAHCFESRITVEDGDSFYSFCVQFYLQSRSTASGFDSDFWREVTQRHAEAVLQFGVPQPHQWLQHWVYPNDDTRRRMDMFAWLNTQLKNRHRGQTGDEALWRRQPHFVPLGVHPLQVHFLEPESIPHSVRSFTIPGPLRHTFVISDPALWPGPSNYPTLPTALSSTWVGHNHEWFNDELHDPQETFYRAIAPTFVLQPSVLSTLSSTDCNALLSLYGSNNPLTTVAGTTGSNNPSSGSTGGSTTTQLPFPTHTPGNTPPVGGV